MTDTTTIAPQPTGWASITDVPCPSCTHGVLRWAEAGYVPGWRECDVCGRQYAGDPATGRLTLRRKAQHRCTRKHIASALARRAAQADAAARADVARAASAARRDLDGSYHGTTWHALGGYYEAGEADGRKADRSGPLAAEYWRVWRAGADHRAVAIADALPASLILPGSGTGMYGRRFRPRVIAISRDGEEVVLYRDGAGGTYVRSVADALAGVVS